MDTLVERPPLTKRLKRFLRYLLVRAALALVGALPLGFARWLGAGFGRLAFALAGGERRKALKSLARAFPEKSDAERHSLARASFRHLGMAAFEVGATSSMDRQLDRLVRWEDADRRVLDAALARGKGVVFVSGHVGNWELLARRVSRAGYPSQSIAKETTDPRLTALVGRFRELGGVRSIWRGQEGAARAMLRALKAGEILGLLIDQDTRVQSLFVPFFGELAATPRAAADLALRTGAAVVVGFCQREREGYRLWMEEVAWRAGTDREADALALTAALSERIEAAIRRAPEQWVWMHQRWKTRPPPAS
ncbi:Lipid A biosynthesis lauroyl acyltransferase [Cystobacter fuscus DSM 2262]|uniref:Lipid A biosynthesis lauroyl acyltransferase n=1 Tax=Cystobacter fuscus (strain ATCC 25194 / DSM 2262 / NBRC 100088 / M29) TaxID=1242864 RepID=S9QGP9_CYSF2|nr:lysophospholipid acyltransferase family protein [Cystobacter fuscus]EPX60494.1 Lipid A biosynthesis lauroyl acyltransferase [Cystobacter fuscus DSM 2262]